MMPKMTSSVTAAAGDIEPPPPLDTECDEPVEYECDDDELAVRRRRVIALPAAGPRQRIEREEHQHH